MRTSDIASISKDMVDQAREAAALYAQAKTTTEQMATAVGNEALAAIFLQSGSVHMISESFARTL